MVMIAHQRCVHCSQNIAVGLLQTQKLREEAREEKHQLAKDKRLTWQQKVSTLCQAECARAATSRCSSWGACSLNVCWAGPCPCCLTAFSWDR